MTQQKTSSNMKR